MESFMFNGFVAEINDRKSPGAYIEKIAGMAQLGRGLLGTGKRLMKGDFAGAGKRIMTTGQRAGRELGQTIQKHPYATAGVTGATGLGLGYAAGSSGQ